MENAEEIKKMASYCLNCKTKPCQKGCPLGNDIPNFIACMKEEKWREAYDVLANTTVLSAICGNICPHQTQCQGHCVRGIKQEPVQIGKLERCLGEIALKEGFNKVKDMPRKDKSIAIVGGGPAGLTAAAFLAKKGYGVTIFEQEELLRRNFKLWNSRISFILCFGKKSSSVYFRFRSESEN